MDGSNRQPKFILPSIKDRLNEGLGIKGLSLEIALWCRYCFGESESGKSIHIDDIHSDRLKKKAREAREQPAKFLEMDDIFGELANAPVFREDFSFALKSLWSHGVEKTLKDYILAN